MAGREGKLSGVSSYKGADSITKAPPSWPPKGPASKRHRTGEQDFNIEMLEVALPSLLHNVICYVKQVVKLSGETRGRDDIPISGD